MSSRKGVQQLCDWLARDPALAHLVNASETSQARRVRWNLIDEKLEQQLAESFWKSLLEDGAVPATWATAEHRSFRSRVSCKRCHHKGKLFSKNEGERECEVCRGRGELEQRNSTPMTLRACLTFSSRPELFEWAEVWAHEIAERIEPWLQKPSAPWSKWRTSPIDGSRMIWRSAKPEPEYGRGRSGTTSSIGLEHEGWAYFTLFAVEAVSCAVGHGFVNPWPVGTRHGLDSSVFSDGWPFLSEMHEEAEQCWQDAVRRKLVVPAQGAHGSFHRSNPLIGRAFADFADPFEPLLSLWRAGIAVEDLTPEGITLVAAERPGE
jgi:hypothetical protein